MLPVDTVRFRPSRLNVEAVEGYAWTMALHLTRDGAPVDLTGAAVAGRFAATAADGETALEVDIVDAEAGKIAIGQSAATTGRYALVVTEAGAGPRVMLTGYIQADSPV